eukprot:8471190-Heterocapsa_arctica.AAC.1
MNKILKPDLLRTKARLESIENNIGGSKEMSEIYFKDIDKQLEQEHFSIKDRLQTMFRYMKKGKDIRSEERGPKTEESSSEEKMAEEMTGAKKNDMSNKEENDCRKWMDEHPH